MKRHPEVRSEAMRILIRTELYRPTLGGVQSHVELLAKGLARRGHEVLVLTERQSVREPSRETIDGVQIVRTPGYGTDDRALVAGIASGIPAFIRNALRYDLWHTHVLFAAVPAWIARMLGRRRPHVITLHTSRFLQMAGQPRWHPVIRTLLHCAEEVLATSRELRDVAHRVDPRSAISEIVNAVDTEHFRPTMPMLRPNRPGPVVVCPRRLVRKNGIDVLLAAWPAIVEVCGGTLFICGIGPERDALEQQARDLRISNSVQLYGAVDHPLMPAVLSSADLVVVPSRVEATSIAALEAMACERVVVASNVGGLPEILDDEIGRLVPPENPTALAAAVVGVLGLSREARAEIGRRARQRVVERWSLDPFIDQHLAVYERAIEKARRKWRYTIG